MIVLDTSVLIWGVSHPEQLSTQAAKVIVDAGPGDILVSSISIWEIALLIKKKRLKLNCEGEHFIHQLGQISQLTFVPVDNDIAACSVRLNGALDSDPTDRIVVATALIHGARLVTSDQLLIDYAGVETVW